MAKKVKITADSTCDLPQDIIEKYNIEIIPLYVNLGNKSYRDRIDMSPDMIFSYYAETHKLAATSAINIIDYTNLFNKYISEDQEIIHISLSSEISSCYQNACLAASELDGVYIVDSKNLSTGSGHLVLLAADLANNGLSAKEIYDELNKARNLVDASFVIDTLEYLYKGGRCSALAVLGANILNLKPCIDVKDGKMGVTKKYRGKMEQLLLQYTDDRLSDLDNINGKRIFITYAGVNDKIVNEVRKKIECLNKFDEIITSVAGSAITCHCGPGTLGVLLMKKSI